MGDRRLNCDNGFRGIGTLGGGVSSVLEGMMDNTDRDKALSTYCPISADGWKQNCFSGASRLWQERAQSRMRLECYTRLEDFKYKTPIGFSGSSKSKVRGADCASVKDLKLLRAGLTYQPLSISPG